MSRPSCKASRGESIIDRHPTLPPGFRGLPVEDDPWGAALRAAEAGAEPGSTFWTGAGGRCAAAFVFAPDRPIEGPGVLLSLGSLALYDALAVLAPPHVPLRLLPPDGLAVDGARAATLRAAVAPAHAGMTPDWAVLGLDVAIDMQAAAPGETPDETCLIEEGFGGVTPAEVLAHVCRQLLGWIDLWRDEGRAALDAAAAGRALPLAVLA